jgi:protease I
VPKQKVVMIIPPIDFRDEELFVPKELFEDNGIFVHVASTVDTQRTCIGMLKGTIVPDLKIADIRVENYDAFVYIGGDGATFLWYDTFATKIAADAIGLNKIVAAISNAPVILANANILLYKRVTVHKNEEGKMLVKGAYCTGARVEFDGNIITANGPESAEQFARSIIKGLKEI